MRYAAAMTAATLPTALTRRSSALAADCARLVAEHGADAPLAARSRALAGLARDNAVDYLHWRAVERLSIALDAATDATRH